MPSGYTQKAKIGLLAAETPPPLGKPSATQAALKELIPTLREQKGTWFKVGEFESVTGAQAAKFKASKNYPKVEWTARRHAKGSVLYGRYVG
jgi:hypothetical protein